MIQIDELSLLEACQQLTLREQNDGSWPDGKIPDIFTKIRDTHLPILIGHDEWFTVTVAVIYQNAVRLVNTFPLLTALAQDRKGIKIKMRRSNVTVETLYEPLVVGVGATLQSATWDCIHWLKEIVYEFPFYGHTITTVTSALRACGCKIGQDDEA